MRKFLLVSPTPCHSLAVDCECSALVLTGQIIAVVSPWLGWTLWSAEPCQAAGLVWRGVVRSDAGEVMSSAERKQAFPDGRTVMISSTATDLVQLQH